MRIDGDSYMSIYIDLSIDYREGRSNENTSYKFDVFFSNDKVFSIETKRSSIYEKSFSINRFNTMLHVKNILLDKFNKSDVNLKKDNLTKIWNKYKEQL